MGECTTQAGGCAAVEPAGAQQGAVVRAASPACLAGRAAGGQPVLCTPPWPAPTTRPFPPAAAPPTDCRVGRQDPAHCGAGRERAGAEGLPAARVALCGGQEDQRAGAREAAPGAAGSPGSPAFGLLLQGASTPSQEAEGAVPDGCDGRALTARAAGAHAASQPWPAPPSPRAADERHQGAVPRAQRARPYPVLRRLPRRGPRPDCGGSGVHGWRLAG